MALLLSNSPLGFVAILGVVALVGILIRNSVILVVQIETLRKEGLGPVGRRREGVRASVCGRSCSRRRLRASA